MKIVIIIFCILLISSCSSIRYNYKEIDTIKYEIDKAEAKLVLIATVFFGSMLYEFNK